MGPVAPEVRPFGRFGALLGSTVVALIAGVASWSALAASPTPAQHPIVFGGSLVLSDTRPLSVMDLATGAVTVRLEGVDAQVGAANYGQVQPVAVRSGTMLVDRVTGSFNFLGADDYVDDPKGAGISLGPLARSTGARGVASGADAYVLRSAPASTVSLVGPETVETAARTTGPVAPLGSVEVPGSLDLAGSGSAAEGGALWALYRTGSGCEAVEVVPTPATPQGLVATREGALGVSCARAALEAGGSTVGLAQPGQVQLFRPGGLRTVVPSRFTAAATQLVPVKGAVGPLWWLAGSEQGWTLFGVSGSGRVLGPFPLPGLAAAARPVEPALSAGVLYTLDAQDGPQPTLWTVEVADGHMAPLVGESRYPLVNTSERDDFHNAEVLLDGPRVVFNDPGSLDAVVVFTDGSRPPLAVDKSVAVPVSATGPADLEAPPPAPGTGPVSRPPSDRPPAVPVVAPVSQQVTCAKTTEKPYAPQVISLTPSPQTVLVQWSYQLLDQTDCEPDSWTVQVMALSGAPQPQPTIRPVTGQEQYLFSGLDPTTTYRVIVTAFINTQSTSSSSATFTTLARGPDAPLAVTTTGDGHGDWDVSWTPCTTPAHPSCVVPAARWTVQGTACGGSFVGTPPSIEVPGDATNVVINASRLGLLGDSLSFQVQGSLPSGLSGDPTSDQACTQAWEAPTASELAVAGSGTAAPDGTITATVVATASGDLANVMSSHPGAVQLVYRLDGQTSGPTDLASAVFKGLPAGTSLTPSVTVYPAGHPGASITVDGVPFERTLTWPREVATAVGTVDPDQPDQGTVTVELPPDTPQPVSVTSPAGSSSGPLLQCGGAGGAVSPVSVGAVTDHSFSFAMGDLVDTGGQCALSFTLADTATPDPYGVPSPGIEADFTIGQQPAYRFHQGYAPDCSNDPQEGNRCGPGGQPWQLVVTLDNPPAVLAGGHWTVSTALKDPRGGQEPPVDDCASSAALADPSFPYTITLPAGCLAPQMDYIDVTVSYTYLGTVEQADAGYPDNKQGREILAPTATTTTTTTTTTMPPSTTTTARAAR
jgi:hypothetical protein